VSTQLAVKDWHVGKLGLLWGWVVMLTALTVDQLKRIDKPLLGFIVLGGMLAMPVVLSIVTWRWLSGREK